MQNADSTVVACHVSGSEESSSAWYVAVCAFFFFGLGRAVVRGIGEWGKSKYMLNSTAQASISK